MSARVEFDLANMTPEARAVWLDVYGLGYRDGVSAGRQQIEDEWRGQHEASAAVARQVAEMGPYAERAERRGQTRRAEAQRRILRERDIA